MQLSVVKLLMNRKGIFVGDRIGAVKKAMIRDFEFDAMLLNSSALENVWTMWADYIALEKENCRDYDKLVRAIKVAFGEKIYEWLIAYTTYLVRTKRLIDRRIKDRIVEEGYMIFADMDHLYR